MYLSVTYAHLLLAITNKQSRMMLHVAHAARHGHHKILVRTVDTDVVVLAVMVAETLSLEHEVWLAFGTGKNFCYFAVRLVDNELSSKCC